MFRRLKYRLEYTRKQRADKRRLRKYSRAMRNKIKSEFQKERKEQIRKFLSNPFAPRELTPEQLLRKEAREKARKVRKIARKRWIQRFKKNPFKAIFYRERSEEEIQLAQWRKSERKIAFKNRIKETINASKEVLKIRDLRNRFILNILQSSSYFILTFLIVYVFYQIVTILVAQSFDIPTIWYYYRVKFPLFTGSHLYTRAALISIFASGPIISLTLAFVFFRLFFSRRLFNQNLKLFYLWGFINGINLFFGSYVAGFITRTEFIYVSEWIFLSNMFDVEEIFFAFMAITISLIVGRLVIPLFLLTSGSVSIIVPKYRLHFFLSQVIIPWIIGATIFFLLTNPTRYLPLTLKTLTPAFILIPSLFLYNSARYENVYTTGVIRKTYFRWSIVIIVLALLFFYRILLNFGLKFF